MATRKLNESEIAIRIVPKRARWPESGSSTAWTRAHDCVDAFQQLVRGLEVAAAEVEQRRELSAGAIAHRRAELCDQALGRLVNFPAFKLAEKALSENIVALERLIHRDPQQVQTLQKLKRTWLARARDDRGRSSRTYW